MKVWLYYRLSRDDDEELNSLTNQKKILVDYANAHEHEIVGESFDDNVSGMSFDREGIEKIYDVVDSGKIEAIIVKDLSRLGRHRTQTALFIDYLKTNNVRVLSVTENIDTFNEDDDLLIGFKGIINDFYAKDMSRKIRSGYRQKQKEGICNMPPMGYYKDKNIGEIIIMEEPANVVRQIFTWYLDGYGIKAIARMLNEKGIKSAAYYQKQYNKKNLGSNKPQIAFKYLWENTAVKRILENEFYIGTLICHKQETNKISKTRKTVPNEEQIRHENFAPPIISKEMWEQAQFLLSDKPKRNVRAGKNKPHHRYTGLLECEDCGCSFVAHIRRWQGKPDRIEYTCNGYHRYTKTYCTPHRIDESTLDKLINNELIQIKSEAHKNWESIENDVKVWVAQKNNVSKRIDSLNNQINSLELDIEKILMERINDKENRAVYDKMIEKRKTEIAACREQIQSIKNIDDTIKKRKADIKQSIDLIDEIVASDGISNTHLRMLVEKILIREKEDGLSLEIILKAPFLQKVNEYDENGEISACFVELHDASV